MSVYRITLYGAACDRCPRILADPDHDGDALYEQVADLRDTTRDQEWTVTPEGDWFCARCLSPRDREREAKP